MSNKERLWHRDKNQSHWTHIHKHYIHLYSIIMVKQGLTALPGAVGNKHGFMSLGKSRGLPSHSAIIIFISTAIRKLQQNHQVTLVPSKDGMGWSCGSLWCHPMGIQKSWLWFFQVSIDGLTFHSPKKQAWNSHPRFDKNELTTVCTNHEICSVYVPCTWILYIYIYMCVCVSISIQEYTCV